MLPLYLFVFTCINKDDKIFYDLEIVNYEIKNIIIKIEKHDFLCTLSLL